MVKNERADKLYREAIVSGVELGQEKNIKSFQKFLDDPSMLAIWLLTLNLQGNGSVASAEPLSYGFSIILDKDDGSRHRRSARNKDVDSNSKTKLASYPRPTGRRRGTTAAFKRKTIDRLNPGLPKPVLQVRVIESN
ncbi:hypothetical protein HZH66_001252 [Vespula vulgaris]|uniref:Uncharacterized protein n=1 Tax=Vespula vulgaris TaxID=7454 RepID=A0A834KSR3_VESVU|nr:hypothetical protein HZH66_001252 [Vespula vulgaris]